MLTRRKLIASLGWLLAGFTQRGLSLPLMGKTPAEDQLAELLKEGGYDIDRVGRRYLELHRADGKTLYAGLQDLIAGQTAVTRQHYRQRCQRDFAQEDILVLDGWVLSRTEARYCAYSYLLRSGHAA